MNTSRMLVILVGFVAILVGIFYTYIIRPPNEPSIDYEKWWGVGRRPDVEDDSIRPFKIEFNESDIQDLKQRLKNRRPFTKPLQGIKSEYGMNTHYLETVLKHWTDKYDVRERMNRLNRFFHYKTKINGLDIHFIRVIPQVVAGNVKVLPLLMMHGWPSSSKEFDKVIPMLTKPKEGYDFVFEVVAVDLPGFGFSEGTNKPGLNPLHIGMIMLKLMVRLGFHKFYVQAGDWGSQCASHIATLYPNQILGFHSNMPISSRKISYLKVLFGSLYPKFADPLHFDKSYPLSKWFKYMARESGYFHLQATKPDTIGVALTDSPAGLAAYLMEKMAICSNRDQLNTAHGGLENLDLNDVLDTVTIMWMNSCAVTSMRLYAEGFAAPELKVLQEIPTPVPFAAVKFEHEISHQPDWAIKDKYPNLVRSTTYDFGGHFAALHTPQVLADDLFASVAEFIKFRNAQKKS